MSTQEGGDAQNEKTGIPAVSKKMRELELALLQCHQNMDIPEVNDGGAMYPALIDGEG